MLTTTQLKKFLDQSSQVRNGTFHVTMTRMRNSGEVSTVIVPRNSLNFHPRWIKRSKMLSALNFKDRGRAFFSTGLSHHVQLADLFLCWSQQYPDLDITPNVTTQKTTASVSLANKLQVPDLSICLADSQELYIELERTLKGSQKYLEKWGAYEASPNVCGCLYFVDDTNHIQPLTKLASKFFRRTFKPKDFFIGFLSFADFVAYSFSCSVNVIGVHCSGSTPLDSLIESVSNPVSNPLSGKNFSPPTIQEQRAFSALRADSSPPTISNEWVCKQTGERSQLEELPKL